MIQRELITIIKQRAKKMPVICITGPRQSGKTTLVKKLFQKYRYVSLEDRDTRNFALRDARGFLEEYGTPLIIDEAQYAPDLFSYIQTRVDESRKNGEYILTGSQHFQLLESISQSLAGRISIFHLLPFSISELKGTNFEKKEYENYLLNGFYPRLYDQKLKPSEWIPEYVEMYIERDVRQIINVSDLDTFSRFVKLCAGRTGQLLNLSSIGIEIGKSHNTVRSWLSILQTSFIVFLIQPYHKNFNKRILKSPKLYFYDTGLACYLLGIKTTEQLNSHYHKGALFENMIFADLMKNILNKGERPRLYFWRDNTGNEVDCIVEDGTTVKPLEIKSGRTINEDFFKGLNYYNKLSKGKTHNSFLIYGGDQSQKRSYTNILSWKETNKI